jgi:hypothetical protein
MERSPGIDRKSPLLLGFAPVHIGDRGKVDDHIRPKETNGFMGMRGPGDIQFGKVHPDDLVPNR